MDAFYVQCLLESKTRIYCYINFTKITVRALLIYLHLSTHVTYERWFNSGNLTTVTEVDVKTQANVGGYFLFHFTYQN